jgi:hypothetical protein
LQNPGKEHWIAAKRVLRYLKGTKDKGLGFLKADSGTNDQVIGFCDSDCAGDRDTKRSITGYVF